MFEDTDLYGNDIGEPIIDVSLEACQSVCASQRQCKAFTYNISARACFTKAAAGQKMTFSGAVSGVKQFLDGSTKDRWQVRPDGNLNLRSGPSGDMAIVKELAPDTKLREIRRSDNWSEVQLENGQTGWVNNKYIVRSSNPAPASLSGRYAVQVASNRRWAESLKKFADMQRRYPLLLANYQPLIQRIDLGTRGIFLPSACRTSGLEEPR